MCRAELLAQQPVLSGAVVFGACVCGRVTTRLVQTCAVTIREPVGSTRRPWSGSIKTSADGHVHTSKTIYGRISRIADPLLPPSQTKLLLQHSRSCRRIDCRVQMVSILLPTLSAASEQATA